jgi:hypothetical protein
MANGFENRITSLMSEKRENVVCAVYVVYSVQQNHCECT